MAPNKRTQKKPLQVECEWASCGESFNQMENFCKHAEAHLTEEEEEAEGGFGSEGLVSKL